MPLAIVFIDFEKAFNSIKSSTLIDALAEHVSKRHKQSLRNIHKEENALEKLQEETREFKFGRNVRTGVHNNSRGRLTSGKRRNCSSILKRK